MAVVNYTRYDSPEDGRLEVFNEVELGDCVQPPAPASSAYSVTLSSLCTADCLLTFGAVVILLLAIAALAQPWVVQAYSMVLPPRLAPDLRWAVATTSMMPVVAQSPCPTCAPFQVVFSAAALGAVVGLLFGILVLHQTFGFSFPPTISSPARDEGDRGAHRTPDCL